MHLQLNFHTMPSSVIHSIAYLDPLFRHVGPWVYSKKTRVEVGIPWDLAIDSAIMIPTDIFFLCR